MKPLVSIVISAYNVENYISQCIDSLLSQSLQEIEIILVDDGSTDRTGKIAIDYSIKDKRLKYVKKENGGLGSGRNYGIKLCRGEYVGFIDGDDFAHEDMYRSLLKLAYKHCADIVSCLHTCFWDGALRENEIYPKYPFSSSIVIFDHCDPDKYKSLLNYSVCNKIFKKTVSLNFREGIIHEDIPVMFDVYSSNVKIVCIDKPFHFYRQSRDGKITLSIGRTRFDIFKAYDEIEDIIKKKELSLGWENYFKKWTVDYFLSVYSLIDVKLKKEFLKIGSIKLRSNKYKYYEYINLACGKKIRFTMFYFNMNFLLRIYSGFAHFYFGMKKYLGNDKS